MFIDTHAHLTDKAFEEDIELVMKKIKDSMVDKVITSGYDLASSIEAVNFAQSHDGVYASIGIYPENIYEFNDEVENALAILAKNEKVVAVGEIGLQYTPDMPDKEVQKAGFAKQIDLAHRLHKPIVIHCRDAYGDTLEILKQNAHLLTYGGTMHCFGGSYEYAKEILKLGLHISVGGVSTFKNATSLQEALKQIPLDRIILETDCPYLAPTPFRSKRNDSSYLSFIGENLAKLKGVSEEEVGNITTQNARRLFSI